MNYQKEKPFIFVLIMKKLICLLSLISLLHNAQAQTAPGFSFGLKVYGHGKPMILIPGLKGNGPATYATTVAHYKDHYKCYVITLAGFAGQPASKRDSDLLKGQRDELIRFIKQEHMDKPVLVGFSFGGVLALWMASTAPELFGKIVDIDGVPFEATLENPTLNVDSFKRESEKIYHKIMTASPQRIAYKDSVRHTKQDWQKGFEFLKSMVDDSEKIVEVLDWDTVSDLKATGLMLYEMDTLDLRNAVANIRSPILLLGSWIGYDSLKTKEAVQQRYAEQFTKAKNCKIVFSEQGKHFLMWNDYDWYIKEIDEFLAEPDR